MRRFLKVSGLILGILVLIAVGAVSYISYALPNVSAAPDIEVEPTPERLARGEYLATSVMGCLDCHAKRDFGKFTAPVIAGTEGGGGERWTHQDNFPGVLYAPNISPTNLSAWTDGEIYRAITTGVNKDGKALFPIMPYQSYAQMDKEDIYSVIAYLRTIPPSKHQVPERKLDFPLNLIVNTIPADQEKAAKRPAASDRIAYGKYMTTAAVCADCHTPQEKGQYIEEMYMAGGFEFNMRNGTLSRSINLTPHPENGIGSWSEEDFLNKFRNHRNPEVAERPIAEGEYNSMMPWSYYARMTDDDLAAIYHYLKSLKPIDNKVERYAIAQ